VKLEGRGIVITGASQGLGRAIALACVTAGAHVFLCARELERLHHTQRELASLAPNGQRVFARVCDVSDPDDVLSLVESARRALPRLDGLVNNAGVYGPKGLTEEVEWKAWKHTIEINLMGTVLLCRAVLPVFRKQGYGKIVNLSGGGAATPLPHFSAYAVSKAGVVRFTETLAYETRGAGIDVNAVAPGALNTRLLDEVLAAGPGRVGREIYERSLKQKQRGGVPLEKGAALCVFLLSNLSDGITGRLISAVWDPWQTLPERRSELAASDLYTLRRILPRDRGYDWN
jgi:NAD(P)-dependent dehydrogenase (short-subunit alcohol dehydrogenase family)